MKSKRENGRMLDSFNRQINYLRISVTDRCNLRCTYCMPECGIQLLKHEDILTFEEIYQFTKEAVERGIEKVRITGGEPLVRKGIADLVKMLASIDGIKDLSMTTNGILLEKFASTLSKAGLQRVNISLDTIDPNRYMEITRTGDLSDVMKGIEAAIQAGLTPIKINCVVKKSPMEKDALDVAGFCKEKGLQIRYIREMDLEKGRFSKVIGGEGGHCSSCNRLRLTANGRVKPCLFNNLEYNIRELGNQKAIEMAVHNKPEKGTVNETNKFCNIGG
ncbi:MAG: GTP 3',8-cyclase MoaA [Bacteroidales bacterium]|nr:GTP 3',8-cyclase MoaA [Bacteroidales bacterium]